MGHFVQAARVTTAPHLLCSIAYDPIDCDHVNGGYVTRAGSWTVRSARRVGTRWIDHGTRHYPADELSAMWADVDSLGSQASRVYVVTECASDVLTLSRFWDRVDDGEVSIRLEQKGYVDAKGKKRKRKPHPLVLSGSPDVVGWSVGRSEYRAVGISNHIACPLIDCARLCMVPDPPSATLQRRPSGAVYADSLWTAGALLAVYQRLVQWWLKVKGGRWSDTIGAAGWQWWRTTIEDRAVLEHVVEPAMAMERAAVYGGRAQLFFYGQAGCGDATAAGVHAPAPARNVQMDGRLWKMDIRSMYASILRDECFPEKLLNRARVRNAAELGAVCRSLMAVATVRVRLESPRLPFRDRERGVVYPVGEWWTTLTTPELEACMARGELLEVGECWTYTRGRPFRRWASELIGLRMEAKRVGDSMTDTICKTIANALGGRLARVSRGWVTFPDHPSRQRWGEWMDVGDDPKSLTRWRGIAGVSQRHVERGDRPGGLTAMYAHLTAYGRVRLARIIDAAGPEAVLWCDTDGVIVTDAGRAGIERAGLLRANEPGWLRIDQEVMGFTGRQAKQYWQDGQWTLAGSRDDWSAVDDHTIRSYLTVNPVRSGIKPGTPTLPSRCRTYALDSIPLGGEAGRDGWLIPPVASGGGLIQPTDAPDDSERDYYASP